MPAGGDIAGRFPDRLPLTPELLHDLYVGAGCSSIHIELVTGQSAAVICAALHRQGITLRPGTLSPAVTRMRATARAEFLAGIVSDYQHHGSTRLVADTHGVATDTVRRWLHLAGVAVPERGRWPRTH